ncbi:TraR/DksA C4-type zinc finger protein [Acidovorax kalamii]|uniref:TraR/DksA C4-type zinc finger protein n=1 Tax=Acidovorax kalamii TaxID=2004485 RepID=UPI0020912277|nr:TraR/DksA C4-type zinc finger protein [Acidovorax kalamii]MCO5356563.1 TraR/DksA C4-type zinc finger protein [Acidovorax kalamii]
MCAVQARRGAPLIDDIDRAQAREAEILSDALRDHTRRAGLAGKTAADSAAVCQTRGCGEPISQARRQASPGCQYCVACQGRIEKTKKGAKAR